MRNVIAFSLLITFLAGAVGAQEGIVLRYEPTKEPSIYRKVHTRKQTQSIMNKDIKTEMTQTEISSWTAAKVKDHLEFKSETKHLQAKVKITDQEEYTFDSKKNDNEKGSTLGGALTPLYDRLGTGQFTFTVTPRGKLLKMAGYKELLGDVFKDNPLAAQFGGGGSEEAGKMLFGDYFIDLPDKGVQQGARWDAKEEITLEKFAVIKGKRNFVYDGEGKVGKHKTAKFTFTDELTIDLDLDSGGAKVTGTLTLTESKGTIHFDAKNGRLVSLTHDYRITGNLNVAAGGQNIAVGNDQTEQVRIELLDKLPE